MLTYIVYSIIVYSIKVFLANLSYIEFIDCTSLLYINYILIFRITMYKSNLEEACHDTHSRNRYIVYKKMNNSNGKECIYAFIELRVNIETRRICRCQKYTRKKLFIICRFLNRLHINVCVFELFYIQL